MTHTSPATYLVWSVITALLGTFLIFHLWSFDRFNCLKWNSGPSSGTFKRVMTYSYLITVPLIFTYSLGNTIIKYREGFIQVPFHGVVPKPYQLWGKTEQATILPLRLIFSIGWSFEMVTHLEELCFWLFLVNSGSSHQNWFHSPYFKTWIGGSTVAVIYMPLVTVLTRKDSLKNEAFTFLAGSLGSLSLTLWFIPILWTFPSFLKNLRVEGVDTPTIVRLTKFSELNTVRVVFRLLFTVPLLILGVDGVRPHNHINESMLWTDFLATIAGFGCSISSGITLVIFFPRNIENEIAARDAAKEKKRGLSFGRSTGLHTDIDSLHRHTSNHHGQPISTSGGTYLLTSSPIKQTFDSPSYEQQENLRTVPYRHEELNRTNLSWHEERDVAAELPAIKPNRKKGDLDIEMSSGVSSLTEANLSVHNFRTLNVNPMISNFTSPIDLVYVAPENGNTSRLTFNRR